MAGYPFIYCPTGTEFLTRLSQEHGVRPESIVVDYGSGPEKIHYLTRKMENGETLFYPLPLSWNPDEHLTPSVIRSVCNHLQIGLCDFGFTIG